MPLLPDSSVPLYLQLKELLEAAIDSGSLPPGARLPSERELAETYQVSRMTARQALQILAHDGRTVSRVGKGTFVSEPKIPQELQALTSFSEEMARLGMKTTSRVLTAEVRPASDDIARRLHLLPGTEIVVLVRVRCGDDLPMALESAHLNHALCPGLLGRGDFSRVSLYDVLRHSYGLSVVRAEQIIETRLPQSREADALGIDRLTPVMNIERTTFDVLGRPVEFVRSVYRGDKYQFRTVLTAAGWTAAPVKDTRHRKHRIP